MSKFAQQIRDNIVNIFQGIGPILPLFTEKEVFPSQFQIEDNYEVPLSQKDCAFDEKYNFGSESFYEFWLFS